MMKRPYKLCFTKLGIFMDGGAWGTYTTPEKAWDRKDKHWAAIIARRWQWMYPGYWVVVGPDGFFEFEPVDEAARGKPFPFHAQAKERTYA